MIPEGAFGSRSGRSYAGWVMPRDKTSSSSGIPSRGGPRAMSISLKVVNQNPDAIVAVTDHNARAIHAANAA